MAYSKAKLKSSGNKGSCFRPFWIGKLSRQMFTYVDFTILTGKHLSDNFSVQNL
jgi:hypothetical protein